MTKKKPHILLTNDDGIRSAGLWAAASELSKIGYVTVAAPRQQSSGMGRSLPSTSDGIIHKEQVQVNGQEWSVYAVGGSPAQAVLHGILEIVPHKPDLIVSGINYGENVGLGITISGTVGAAMEAAELGFPALAVSLQTETQYHDLDSKAGEAAALISECRELIADLSDCPERFASKVDWAAKRMMLEQVIESEGLGWDHPSLRSYDLEYHNIDPEKSLFYAYQDMGETTRLLDDVDIVTAMTDPPQNTRAKGRSKLVEEVLKRRIPKFYMFDWNGVAVDRHRYIEMSDPFETYDEPYDQWQIPVK